MTLFLSWSGQYALEIAEALKITIDQLCASGTENTPATKTWLSSVDIELGGKWHDEIHAALSGANVGVVVVTQDAIDSQWLPHEAGALSARCDRLIILLADAPLTVLPDPLQSYQYGTLATEDISKLLRTLADDINAEPPSAGQLERLYKDIREIRERNARLFVTPDDNRWKNNFERPFAIARQRTSPYDLEQLIKITRRRLVLVAQNHYYMTNPGEPEEGDRRFWPRVRDLLEKAVNIDIVAMHPEATPRPFPGTSDGPPTSIHPPDALALWACYMRTAEFLKHAEETWRMLEGWDTRYRELRSASAEKLGVLRLWRAYFTPVTVSFSDPDESEGLLVISPRMAHEANDSRPQFIVKNRTCPSSFAYYWGIVNNSFVNAWSHHNP